jgi:hypothetical protein
MLGRARPSSAEPTTRSARRSLDFYQAVARSFAPREARRELRDRALIDRIKQTMIALKVPRAIEIIDATVLQIDR